MRTRRDPRDVPELLRGARPPAPALGLAGPAARRHLDAAHRRRHAAVQALLPGSRGAAVAARLTSCQRCFRTPDIEEVGNTRRHLTFFEMLGNFSFGDYFKQRVDARSAGSSRSRASGSTRSGSGSRCSRVTSELGLGPDEESIEIWREIGVPDERIVRLPASENFWQAGPTGPCGPCSEMYLDRGREFGARRSAPRRRHRPLPGVLEPRLHDLRAARRRVAHRPAPAQHRYRARPRADGDDPAGRRFGLRHRCLHAADRARARSCRARSTEATRRVTRAMRIVADHTRGAVNLIADGVVPSNEERGYVLRRIMRRAIQQGRVLGIEAPWFGRFAERVIEMMGAAYPHLAAERETSCAGSTTRRRASGAPSTAAPSCSRSSSPTPRTQSTSWIDAEDAFRLHDTYGFPYDLTKELLAEQGLAVDDEGFEALMEAQRERARAGADRRRRRPPPAGDRVRRRRPRRRSSSATPSSRRGRASPRPSHSATAAVLVKLEESPFYAEGGGQVADAACIVVDGAELAVEDVYRLGDDQAIRVADGGRPLSGGDQAVEPRRPRHPPRDDAKPHRDPPAARRAARAARHPRPPGGLGRAPRQAALRLHPRRAARAPTTCARSRIASTSGSRPVTAVRAMEMAAGRGRGARRDGAVRREVRRLGADGRGRRGLARALRRHPRRQHRRGRDLRDRLRGFERRQRAPDRGAHRARRDRPLPPP